MTDLEFTFEESPLDAWLEQLAENTSVSGVQLLAMAEGEEEEALETAFDRMEQLNCSLDLTGLAPTPVPGETARRLKLEQSLAEQGLPVEQLDKNDPLRLYLEELASLPVCGEESLLAEQLTMEKQETVRDSLRGKLAELSLSRVVELACSYTGRGVLLLDLCQEGSVGLWRGTENYRKEDGSFSAFRDRWIRFYMEKEVLRQARTAGMGQKLRNALEDYRSVDEKLLAELGRNPTVEEIAEGLHLSQQETAVIGQMVENARMLHRVKTPEPEELPQEEEQSVEDTAYFQMRQRIQDLLAELPEADAQLLSLRYGLEGGIPMNPAQVANKLGITEREVNEREAAALGKLRQKNG